MRLPWMVLLLVVPLSGCGGGQITLPNDFCFGFCGFGTPGPSRYDDIPGSIPNEMRVGDTLRVEVRFVDPTGSVKWRSGDPSVVTWDEPSPPCARDTCRVLRAVAVGSTQVVMDRYCSDKQGDGCGGSTTLVRVLKDVALEARDERPRVAGGPERSAAR